MNYRVVLINSTCLRRSVLVGFESVFVHNPVRFLAVGRPAFVEDKGFPHPDEAALVVDCLVSPRRLPKPGHRRPIRPRPRRILLVLVAKKVPLILLLITDPTPLYK